MARPVDAVLADWPADVEGVCRLFLTRGLGEGLPPTALALLVPRAGRGGAPAHRGHLRGHPEPRRPRRLPRAGAVAARRREDAVLRGQHGRAAARARRRAPTTSSSPRWRASCSRARRRPWSGPPDGALHTPPVETGILPGTTAARLFARAADDGWPTAVTPGTVADLHAADAVWLLSGVRAAAVGAHDRRRPPRRRRAHGAGPGAARPVGSAPGAPGSLVGNVLADPSPGAAP